MLDQNDLQAIAQLVSQSENRMMTYMQSSISQSENQMMECISQSENRMMTYIESRVEKNVQLLAEGHSIILDRLPAADEQEQLKSRVRVLEQVVLNLRTELDELKKAQ